MELEEAIEYLKCYKYDNEVKQAIDTVLKELDKKDKVIDLMTEDLYNNKHWYICSSPMAIKEYFYKQVEE